jgi:Rieske Fe-S protein
VRGGEEKIAAWRDDGGELHVLSAACTHKGCTVTWNNADRTWDCPCHGSMFAADGSVIQVRSDSLNCNSVRGRLDGDGE